MEPPLSTRQMLSCEYQSLLQTPSLWYHQPISFGRLPVIAFVLTKSSSPGGRSFFVFPVNMLWRLIHTDSTLCTGDQPAEPSRSRQIKPFE